MTKTGDGFSVGPMRAWLAGQYALSADQLTHLVTDAADEIDRLQRVRHNLTDDLAVARIEIERLHAKFEEAAGLSHRYRDEAERLRAALERIATAGEIHDPHWAGAVARAAIGNTVTAPEPEKPK